MSAKQIKIKGKRVYKKTLVNNLLSIYTKAQDNRSVTLEGRRWYQLAYNHATRMSAINGLPVYKSAGIIAALSPLSSWDRNKETALLYAQGQRKGLHTNKMIEKCAQIEVAQGFEEVAKILNGDKIVSFYKNICGYNVWSDDVTIDRHAIAAAYGKNISDKDRPQLTKSQYKFIADAYVEATIEIKYTLNMEYTPHQLQAIIWVWWRIYGQEFMD